MPNPMTRIALNFDQATGKAEFKLYNNNNEFDEFKVDKNNIHKIILNDCKLNGIVNLNSIYQFW